MSKAGLFSGEVTPLAPANGEATAMPRSYVWMEYGGAGTPPPQAICTTVWQSAVLTPTLHVAGDVIGIYNDGIIIGSGEIEDDRLDTVHTTNDNGNYTQYGGNNPGLDTGIAQVFFPECQWYNYAGPLLFSVIAGGTIDLTDGAWVESGTGVRAFDQDGVGGLPNQATIVTDNSAADFYQLSKFTALGQGQSSIVEPSVARWTIRKEASAPNHIRLLHQNALAPFTGLYLLFNAQTGVALQLSLSDAENMSFEVRNNGGWWEVSMQIDTQGDGGRMRMHIAPAWNADGSDNVDISATGSCVVGDTAVFLKNGTLVSIAGLRSGALEPKTSPASSVIDISNIHLPAANHSNTQGGYYIEWRPQYDRLDIENNVEILSLNDAAGLLYYDRASALLKATDGTNTAQVTLSIVNGQKYRIAVVFGSSTLVVGVNGLFSTEVTYDGTFPGGADFTVFRNPEAVNYWRELRGYQDTYADTLVEVTGLMAGDDLAVPPNQAYDPLMMNFNGVDSFYDKTNVPVTGDRVTTVARFNIASFSGGSLQRIGGCVGSPHFRMLLFIVANDHTEVDQRNKLVVFCQSSVGATLCALYSLADASDGQDHTVFASYNGDDGVATFFMDGLDADDTGHSNRTLISGTLQTVNSVYFVGADSNGTIDFVDGQIGYFGMKDEYLTNWYDFMDGALPRVLNNQIWTEWGGSQPSFWHDEAKMDESEGTEGVMTANGGITGPS